MQTKTTKINQSKPTYYYSTKPLAVVAIYYLLSAVCHQPCSMFKTPNGVLCVHIPPTTIEQIGKERIDNLQRNVDYIFTLPYDPHELYLKIQQKYPIHKA